MPTDATPNPSRSTTRTARPRAPEEPPGPTVEGYLAALPADARAALKRLRRIIRTAAPGGTEVISYQIPVYRYNGRLLVGFAAFKDHCGFYIMSTRVTRSHAADLEGYAIGKGSIRFSPQKPLPAALVRKLVQARIAENGKAASRKRKTAVSSRPKQDPADS